MTLEETVEYFRDMVEGCGAYELCPCFHDDMEMTKIALSALEKQVAKKPIIDKANLTDFQTFHCPSCNKKIISRLDGEWIAGRLQKYCDDCGQALGWRDTE